MIKKYDPVDFDRIGDWVIGQLVKEEHELSEIKAKTEGGHDEP